jgi:hypothetical protein
MSFSNLVLQDVTGPINIGAGRRARRNGAGYPSSRFSSTTPTTQDDERGQTASTRRGPAIVRNISFSNIHGTVTTTPGQLLPYPGAYNIGEKFSCITVDGVGDAVVENISFSDIHLTFGGGGTAEMGARRDMPREIGEYFSLGAMPAYGFYARGARGITLDNIRFEVASPELRPAVIFDGVSDAAICNFTAEGNTSAESLLRFVDSTDTLITAARVLGSVPVFLSLEGASCAKITIDGGDLSNAAAPLAYAGGADEKVVKLRA